LDVDFGIAVRDWNHFNHQCIKPVSRHILIRFTG
jgi:predicted nucleotidyltransferase